MPGLAVVVFTAFAILYLVDRPAYLAILQAIHVHPFPRPFLDARFVTAQAECWRHGVDVYVRNPCDPLGRTLDYSPLWLRLPFLARGDNWTPVFGLLIDLAFLASLAAMPWAPRGAFEVVATLGAVFSWATLFAAERANTDLLMFAAAVLFAHLAIRSAPARGAGYALVLGAGLLKFYPLAMLALVARERRALAWLYGGGGGLVLAAFVARFHAELARLGANMADALFGDMFGARGLPFGVPLLLTGAPIRAASGTYAGADALDGAMTRLGWALFAAMSGACLLASLRIGRDPALRDALARVEPRARALMLVGAVLCVGCFFGHQNIGYRSVLLLLVLPGLLSLARAGVAWRVTAALVVLAMWDGVVSRSLPGWFALQLAWWWIAAALLGIAVALLGRDVARLVTLRGAGAAGA